MPVVTAAHDAVAADLFIDLSVQWGIPVHVKCEGLNPAGSIKLKVARRMVLAAQASGRLKEDSVLIESSSGNLGVGLAIVAAGLGIRFICITDPLCTRTNLALLRAFGAQVVVADHADTGGYLGERLRLLRRMCDRNPHFLWLNQYENEANWLAHYETTGPEILATFPDLDVLFVGIGTGGTAAGCARYLRDRGSSSRVIAVDSVGSVNFGGPPGPRRIPGLGASRPMPLIDASLFDGIVRVAESEAVATCRRLATSGLLLGGSTGTVLAGALSWLREQPHDQALTCVAISPDFGERYLDTVYNSAWADGTEP